MGGQLGRLQTSARSLELGEDRRHDRVNGGMLKPLDQKLLERRDVLRGCARTRLDRDEIPE